MLSNFQISNFALEISGGTVAAVAIILLIAGLVIGFVLAKIIIDKKLKDSRKGVEDIINKAEEDARCIKLEAKNDAQEKADKMIEEARLENKKLRDEFVKETEERNNFFVEREKTLNSREQSIVDRDRNLQKKDDWLTKKQDEYELKEKDLIAKNNEINEKLEKINSQYEMVLSELERVSNMTKDEAKAELKFKLEGEARDEAKDIIKEIVDEAKESGNKQAREIIIEAIQRCAVEYTGDNTTTILALDSDDMKGRLIGRSGRNIRSIENATGVDVIIDDTPEIITLSCFDPVRREIAKQTIEKLIRDGRIQPSRIEETAEKIRKEIENNIKEEGRSVSEALGIRLHPELEKILGRMKYRTSYGQNMLAHAKETAAIAGMIATELGADAKIARRGALLHDIGKALDHELDGTHVQIGVDVARKYKESEEVIHCIEAHHNDVEMHSIEAVIVQIADAISGARPGARRESLENYTKRLQNIEKIANSFANVEKSFAFQAGRELRVLVKPDKVSEVYAEFMARAIAKRIEETEQYPGQIKVNVIRESRFVGLAK